MSKSKGKMRSVRRSFDSVYLEAALIFISSFCGAWLFVILSEPLTFMTFIWLLILFVIVLILVAVIKCLPRVL